ncbi:hypothetical protein PR202_ga08451 [Eleusine coracana subsp. coracana]|uniref:Uncharacterized protein n=1 Tax=Eleusine coracana subsp. coracana TaxID=191504 RepID=A0AAV5C0B0_ELECO|nr:hypothetical protein PR202_ga08451 [Eleusine coracana subsp. coracana]
MAVLLPRREEIRGGVFGQAPRSSGDTERKTTPPPEDRRAGKTQERREREGPWAGPQMGSMFELQKTRPLSRGRPARSHRISDQIDAKAQGTIADWDELGHCCRMKQQ